MGPVSDDIGVPVLGYALEGGSTTLYVRCTMPL